MANDLSFDDLIPRSSGSLTFDDLIPTKREPEGPPDERSFWDRASSKVGSFLSNVYNNPPPTVAGIRDVIKNAPQAATELTYGSDPEAAREAAGTMLGAAGLGVTGSRALQFPARTAAPEAAAAAPSGVNAVLEAAGRQNVGVPRYLASEGTAVPQVAAGLKNAPWAGEPIINSAEKVVQDLARAKGDIAPAVSPELAGEQASTNIGSWIKQGSQRSIEDAYKAVDKLVDPEVHMPLEQTREAVSQILAERTQGRIPGKSAAVQTVFQAIQDAGGLNYEGMKNLRSFLGQKTPTELAVSGINPGESKRLYGALTKDLKNVIAEAGGPEAVTAWQEANALARLTSMQRRALSKIVGAEGTAAPETVFNRLMNYAGSKSSADIQRLELAKRTMGQAAWEEVGSALNTRLGMAPDGTFSPERFVTAFGNMSPKARSLIFTSEQNAALSDLNLVSQHVRDRINRFSNPSGTGRAVTTIEGLRHMFVDPVTVIASLVGGRLAAEALSRPAVVRAATKVSRAQLASNPVLTQQAQQKFYQIAAREGLLTQLEDKRPK